MKLTELKTGFADNLKYNEAGLIPTIVQEQATGQVLMLAYMNKESLNQTLETGRTCFFSRSRQELWTKGETSGNYQEVKNIFYDCDLDTLLITVVQQGNACHTGTHSCFFEKAAKAEKAPSAGEAVDSDIRQIVPELFEILQDRFQNRPEGSYTTYLFNEGQDKILKKVGEEATEVIIGSKNHSKEEIRWEMADLLYHCLVLLVYHGMKPHEILEELAGRR
jgi:phosphoribosyl-ATP pyrophosphohydrolase/phosphoribosyl-AMP cyclohydrolase